MTNEDIIQGALDRFKIASEAYNTQRIEARDDLRFVAGEQWVTPQADDEMRLTVNLLGPFLRQITSEARSANPAIRVIPVGNGADEDLAEVYAGLIRHIEQSSDADSIYQESLWYAAAGGEGYILLDSEYCSDETFDQELRIKTAGNPEKVFLDPDHQLKDGCDAEWGFVVEDIAHDAYTRQFPNSKLAGEMAGTRSWNQLGLPGDWMSKDAVRVAKYWVKEYNQKTIYLVMDPVTGEQISQETPATDTQVALKKRTVQVCTVKGYLLNATEVLEEITWPGKYIPIVKVVGDTFYVGGQQVQYGAVRHAKDPQRQYNYFTSRQTEMIDLAPKNSFVGATGQFANCPEKWANANRINYGFLDYAPQSVGGNPVPPPTRVSGLDLGSFQGVMQSRQQSLEDLKLVFGLHDAALGRMNANASGVALQSRVEQSSRSTYQYFDNLMVSMRCLGRQLVELIPHFYDTERIVRIVKPDTTEQMVAINSVSNQNRYNLSKGTYDVLVVTGPAYASKRQEAFDSLSGLAATNPAAAQVIGDLIASQVDSPIAKMAAARIKATIPKEILASTGEGDDSEMAPKELVLKLQSDLARQGKELEMKDLENQELQVKVKIAEDTSAMKLTELDIESEHKVNQLRHDQEMAYMEYDLKKKEIELKERQLAIAEKQLEIKAVMAAHEVNETMTVDNVDADVDANIGGKLD